MSKRFKRPKRLQQTSWDAANAQYADLSSPEWVLSSPVPCNFWKDPENHRRYAVWLAQKLNIKQLDDWYQVDSGTFDQHRGVGLLEHYGNSHFRFLREMFPKHNWLEWKFKQVPNGFWKEKENVLRYLKWFEKQVGIRTKEDWYSMTISDINREYGGGLLLRYQNSLKRLLKEAYPNYRWLDWKFVQVPTGFWDQLDNRIAYLRWLGKTVGFKKAEDWYQLKLIHFSQNYGATLMIFHYEHDLLKPLAELFPDHDFKPWMFDRVPIGYWDHPQNCRDYLSWLAEQLNYKQLDNWYDVTLADFRNHFGNGYMQRFNTPYQALQFAYPDHDWLPWRFEKVPQGFWEDRKQVKHFLRWLAGQLEYQSPSDWQKLTSQHLRHIPGGNGLMVKFKMDQIRQLGREALA
jgi:hypothetical protein